MIEQAELSWNGNKAVLPLITGTAGERAIDISKLRDQTGLITLDSGYGNTGSCKSAVTFIEKARVTSCWMLASSYQRIVYRISYESGYVNWLAICLTINRAVS